MTTLLRARFADKLVKFGEQVYCNSISLVTVAQSSTIVSVHLLDATRNSNAEIRTNSVNHFLDSPSRPDVDDYPSLSVTPVASWPAFMEGQAKNEAFFQFTEFDERKLNSKRVYSNVSPFEVELGLIYCSLWRYARHSGVYFCFTRKPATWKAFMESSRSIIILTRPSSYLCILG